MTHGYHFKSIWHCDLFSLLRFRAVYIHLNFCVLYYGQVDEFDFESGDSIVKGRLHNNYFFISFCVFL